MRSGRAFAGVVVGSWLGLAVGCGGEPNGASPMVTVNDAGASLPKTDAELLPVTPVKPPAADSGQTRVVASPPPPGPNVGAVDAGNVQAADASGEAAIDAGAPPAVDGAPLSADASVNDATEPNTTGATIAAIALANVGLGACSVNSQGESAFENSCTGNAGLPEYWCADFVQWVWLQAGVDLEGIDAAAGTFYTYGENFGTLHQTPLLGDAVVFNYSGGAYAEHVAIVTQVNPDGTIETVSGDWGGDGATEAAFASTSAVVHNLPAYPGTVGGTPVDMGMVLAGYVTPVPSGSTPLPSASVVGTGCFSDTLNEELPDNACVQSSADSDWYQCNDGAWAPRASVAWACNGLHPL